MHNQPHSLHHDPLWPRAGGWSQPKPGQHYDLALVGIPTSRTSLSPSNAHLTPAAVREALLKYSGHMVEKASTELRGDERDGEINELLRICDFGDVIDPDTIDGEREATSQIAAIADNVELVVALGGDNALTVPAALGVLGASSRLHTAGLITFDAHHDIREGRSNGSPVRRLIEAGLDPKRIVQVGIADFANSRAYRQRVKELGITVIHRDELYDRSMREIVSEALSVAGSAGGPIHVDLDVDVCDRSVAPGCPASLPGGLQAHELRLAARLLASDSRVRGIDLAEVDVTADSKDGRTVRLVALCVLEIAAGLTIRLER